MTSDAPYHVIFVDIDSLFPPAPEKVYRETIPRVPRGSKLRFVVKSGSDKLLHKPILFTNYPPQSAKNFDRYFYYECKGSHYNGKDDFTIDIHSGEEINRPDKIGCFEYYFQYYVESKGITTTMKGHARTFNVEPILNLKNTIIPQDGIVLQTVVPKFLGDENRVKEICKEASDCGYNMIHFTPIQELGQSNSAYSLYDQLSVSSSFFGKDLPFEERVQKMRELLGILENDYKLLSMVDIVFNHTANNTPWLSEHPEAGYNLDNCPHLRVAYELDEALVKFSRDIVDSKYPEIFPYVGSDDDVRKILDVFKRRVWPGLRMWEYFIVDVKESIDEFKAALMQNKPIAPKYSALPKSRYFEVLKSDGLYNSGSGKRFGYKIKLDTALALFNFPTVNPISANEISSRCNNFREAINAINLPIYKQVDEDLETIIRNLFHRMRRGKLSYDEPLFDSYFTRVIKKETNEIVPLANNGWIWAGNPLIDFASDKSKAYYLREVIIWGDSVKLHYGHSREDNPWLWDHIQKYTELMASLFHGFRIDNAHSTPIHLAQYMLDAARRVRPELYVTAELFTGSPDLDGFWVGQLGINSLIREAIMAYDSWDLGRYVHRYGGKPVASVIWNKPGILAGVPVEMTPPPALFFDCTHDNETPNQKRTAQDALSTAGLVCMTVAAVGSTKGYDEIVPHNINIVQEKRLYKFPSKDVAIAPVKRVLNKLHLEMAQRGFAEVYVHQVENLITVQRHNPYTHEAIFLSAFCAFSHNVHPLSEFASVMKIPGKVTNIIVAARVNVRGHDFREDPSFISGIPTELTMKVNECGDFCELKESIDNGALITEVHLKNFPPGSILSFKTSLFSEQQKSLDGLHSHLKNEGWLFDIIEKLDLIDLNFLLFRCEEEEKAFAGLGSYEVPFFGKFNYCGIASLFYVLQIIRQHNDMGHSVFNNLRAGNWLLDYVSGRLKHYPKLQEIANWFTLYFEHLKGLPRHLIPKYFDIAITRVYQVAQKRAISQFSNFVKSSNNQFIQSLAMTSVQLYGIPEKNAPPNLAAGLPHFSNGYMRAWGRDTFISLRGLLLVVGRFEEAKSLIIGFARCLRHGLIPNLYDGGKSPRYNARDATWFFLQSIQDYCSLAPEKTEILKSKVPRLFPVDTQIEYEKSESVYRVDTLADIIQEIMQKHANGIHFREWNAGPNIDAHMKSEGFNVDITFEKATGFIYGGNSNNCGTWMDKMGESESAKNKGKPATPRDGAAIEIIGLLKSALRWLTALSSSGEFPHTGVKIEQTGENFKYKEWNNILQTSFESHFWIPTNSDDDFFFNINPPLVNRRSIYRDTYRTSESWGDYQLRPNQCIAMAVAPELFDPVHARQALHVIEHVLLGPLGMKTLDPKDWNYRPNYDMSLDGDYNTAKGFNYHQGPEWLWLLGYFLIAKIVFDNSEKTSPVTTFHQITKILKPHMKHIEESNWRGLPELTNENGSECSFSCPTQAWSMASILDAIFEMTKVTRS